MHATAAVLQPSGHPSATPSSPPGRSHAAEPISNQDEASNRFATHDHDHLLSSSPLLAGSNTMYHHPRSSTRHRSGSDPLSQTLTPDGDPQSRNLDQDSDADLDSESDPSSLTLLDQPLASSSSKTSSHSHGESHVAIPMHTVGDKHDRRFRSTTAHSGFSRRGRSHARSHSRSRSRSPSAFLSSLLCDKNPCANPFCRGLWIVASLALVLIIVLSASLLSASRNDDSPQTSAIPAPLVNPISPAMVDDVSPHSLVKAPFNPSSHPGADLAGDGKDDPETVPTTDDAYDDVPALAPADPSASTSTDTSSSQSHKLALARSRHRLPSRLSKLGLELGNLALIRGTAAPRVPTLPRQLGLLAIPVGAKSRALISPVLRKFKAAGFAIYLFHYDTHGPWPEFASDYPSVTAPGQAKFWFAKRYLPPEVVDNYEYIFLWDDDVGFLDMDAWDPRAFVDLMRTYAIHVAQPAIVDGLKDYAQAKVVKWDKTSKAPGRWTSFVEMMFAVYSREAWQNCIWELLPWNGRSYWGTDFAFYPHCAAAGYCRVAVVDVLPVRHMDKHLFKSVSMVNMREMRLYVEAYQRIMCEADAYGEDEADERRRGQLECSYLKQNPLGLHIESFRRIEDKDRVDKETCPAGEKWWNGVKNEVQVNQSGPEWEFVKVEDRP